MSDFLTQQEKNLQLLHRLYHAIISKTNAAEIIKGHAQEINLITPFDIMYFTHELVLSGDDMEAMKTGMNKLLNVTYKALADFPYQAPDKDSYFGICIENNRQMIEKMEKIRPILIAFNKNLTDTSLRNELLESWLAIRPFSDYYVIKENVIFPLVEKMTKPSKCVTMMWSFHDDIRRNLSEMIFLLEKDAPVDFQQMNKLAGALFYNIYAIKFREERILFPFIEAEVDRVEIENLRNESIDLGFPYYKPKKRTTMNDSAIDTKNMGDDLLDLHTGSLTLEQIILIFSHLPVDITYVDEHNKVRFFSNPPHRIFPRTTAVIGRDVNNCHPHESVHVVEKIVESFKNGSQHHADFWINMRGKKILIQYFAVRDKKGLYRGVMEVSQEITEIQSLEGERRILDWE